MIKHWETKVLKLSEVIPLPNNHRIIDQHSMQGLKASIDRFGLVELIVVNKTTKHIISGHQRYAILLQEGVTEAPMIVVDMSQEDEVASSVTMNNPAIEGEFDEPVMELIGQVESSIPDLFSAVRIDDLQESLEKNMDKISVEDNPVEEIKEWDTECPCCSHKWKIDPKNIVVVKKKRG